LLTVPAWSQIPARCWRIIITAEKREENLQKTAIAVTAIGGDALIEAGVS
jgi:iron complex outermembrane receptor protein